MSAATADPGPAEPGPGAGSVPRPELADELRGLLDSLLERAASGTGDGAARHDGTATVPMGTDCGWCPVCALVAALRGERPELTRRLAEQGAGVAATLRALLDSHEHAAPRHAPDSGPEPRPEPAGQRVQRIPVRTSGSAGRVSR